MTRFDSSRLSSLVLLRSTVNSVAWAPHGVGLCLATASADGNVGILTYKRMHAREFGEGFTLCVSCNVESVHSSIYHFLAIHPLADLMCVLSCLTTADTNNWDRDVFAAHAGGVNSVSWVSQLL